MKKNLILTSVKICCAAIFIFFLMSTSQLQLGLLLSSLTHPVYVLGVLALFLLMVVMNAARWYLLNRSQEILLSLRNTLLPTYFGIAYNNILPGSVGGDIVRIHYTLKRIKAMRSRVVMSIFLDRVIGLIGIFVAVCMVSVFRMQQFLQDNDLQYMFAACALFCLVFLFAFLMSVILPKRVGVSDWLNARYGQVWLAKKMLTILNIIRSYRQNKLVVIQAILISVLIQFVMVLVVSLLTIILGLSVLSWVDFLIALALTQIANLIPLSPGGLGIGELAFVHVIKVLNPAAVAGYATVFLAYRIFGTVSYLPGIFYYLFNFNRVKEDCNV